MMKKWKVSYTKKRRIGKHGNIDCVNVFYINAETIEEAISIARDGLAPDTEIFRCEVYK